MQEAQKSDFAIRGIIASRVQTVEVAMEVVYTRCAGLDVHKKTVVACMITPQPQGGWNKELASFSTMTNDLLKLSDWLQMRQCEQVAMESTGEYWRPVFKILEVNFAVMLVNASHIKAVSGRKTDIKDAQWIAELLQHGLLKASFIPPVEQRDLRDLIRHRSNFIRERVNLVNRLQKVLEAANIKLAAVATDVMGVSGRAMLDAIIAGQNDPQVLSELALMTTSRQTRATAASDERTAETLTSLYSGAHCSPKLIVWMKLLLALMRKLLNTAPLLNLL